MSNYKEVLSLLEGLKLKGAVESLDEITNDAECRTTSHLGYLQALLENEMCWRRDRKLRRNLVGAHFPAMKTMEEYGFKHVKGFGKADAASMADLRWLDNHENILFFGPPGIGKTHLAIALGIKAVEAGYTVCFERITSLFKILKTAEIQRKSSFRLSRMLKSNLVIIDEIGYTPIERREANLFFNMISELYEKSSIIITSNKGFDSWAEMMGDQVMTTALLDRLLHHAKVFTMDGMSYRLQGKEI